MYKNITFLIYKRYFIVKKMKSCQSSKVFSRIHITNSEEFTIPETASLCCAGGGIFRKGLAIGNNDSIVPGSMRFANDRLQYRTSNDWYNIYGFNEEPKENSIIKAGLNGELKKTQLYIENSNLIGADLIETEYIVPPENKNLIIGTIQWPTTTGHKNHTLRFVEEGILEPSEGPVPIYDASVKINKLLYFENKDGKLKSSNISVVNNDVNGIDTLSCKSLLITNSAPTSSTSPGTKGNIVWDNDYIYVCVADNTWKRTPLSTW